MSDLLFPLPPAAYGLRDANAFILVYDLLNPESLEYITSLFSSLGEARDMHRIPVVVVGNKTDKVNSTGSSRDKYDYSSSKYR